MRPSRPFVPSDDSLDHPVSEAQPSPPASPARPFLRIALRALVVLGALPFVGWGFLALSLDGPGRIVGAVYALGSLVLLALLRPVRGVSASAALFVLVLAWWLSIEPSNEREWLPEVRALPGMEVEGERLTVTNLRNFEYRSETDFTPRWEQRSYDLSQVVGVDLCVCDWGEEFIVHTMLSWEFQDGQQLCVSIETRKEVGEHYSAVRGFFRQFELYYAVGDERDLIGIRTSVRGEEVRLYRLKISPEQARALLLDYAGVIERLNDEPAWYNAFSHNCTTSIRLHAKHLQIERPWNWRILINGRGEELLYMRGMVNTSLSFEELLAQSDVSAAANAALGSADFSRRIRAGIPTRPTAP